MGLVNNFLSAWLMQWMSQSKLQLLLAVGCVAVKGELEHPSAQQSQGEETSSSCKSEQICVRGQVGFLIALGLGGRHSSRGQLLKEELQSMATLKSCCLSGFVMRTAGLKPQLSKMWLLPDSTWQSASVWVHPVFLHRAVFPSLFYCLNQKTVHVFSFLSQRGKRVTPLMQWYLSTLCEYMLLCSVDIQL